MEKSQVYGDLHLQPLAGVWREGSAGRLMTVTDPYTQLSLLEIPLANQMDLHVAYTKAAEVQPAWAALGPSARAAVLLRAAQIFDERHDELVDWIIRESGSTVLKAEIEWALAKSITLEAASFPSRVHGRIVESNVADKESRVYRRPLGVVGVISPWNFPLHLLNVQLLPPWR